MNNIVDEMNEVFDAADKLRREGGGTIKDGDVMRVPMMLMDSMPKNAATLAAVAADMTTQERDALVLAINDGHALSKAVEIARQTKRVELFDARFHRPGFHQPNVAATKTADEAYDRYEKKLNDAWRHPAPVEQIAPVKPPGKVEAFSGPVPTRAELDAAYDRRNQALEQAYLKA